MNRSRFSNYRRGVYHDLIVEHQWPKKKAKAWVKENNLYIVYAYTKEMSQSEAAAFIHKEMELLNAK